MRNTAQGSIQNIVVGGTVPKATPMAAFFITNPIFQLSLPSPSRMKPHCMTTVTTGPCRTYAKASNYIPAANGDIFGLSTRALQLRYTSNCHLFFPLSPLKHSRWMKFNHVLSWTILYMQG